MRSALSGSSTPAEAEKPGPWVLLSLPRRDVAGVFWQWNHPTQANADQKEM